MSDEAKSRERQTAQEKSDRVIVPSRPGNSGGGKDATPTTRSERASPGHSAGTAVNPRLDRITERARRRPIERYNNLFHHLDVELMTVAFDELHADRAPGADGVTKDEYAVGLQERLHDVVGRLHGRA